MPSSQIVMIPKGRSEDSGRVASQVALTRPLTMLTMVVKLVCLGIGAATVHARQRGFVVGRSMHSNVVGVEAVMVMGSMAWTLDFANTFPSHSGHAHEPTRSPVQRPMAMQLDMWACESPAGATHKQHRATAC